MSGFARTVLGDVDPRRKCRDLILIAAPWLLADIVTKCRALWWLAGKELHLVGDSIRFQLTINESLFGSKQGFAQLGITRAMVLGAALGQGLMAIAGFSFGRAQWSVFRKLVLVGFVLIIGTGLGLFLGSFSSGEPHRLAVHAARTFGSLSVLTLALRLTRSRYLGLALALWISGNLGNATNVLYYPRGVIDFIYVPMLREYIGIFNLSDVALELAKYLLILSPLALILLRVLVRRNPGWEHRLEYVNSPELPKGGTSKQDV